MMNSGRRIPVEDCGRLIRRSPRGLRAPGLLAIAGSLATLATSAAVHQHINAGAHGSEPGAPLYFVNGAAFAAESGFVVPLDLSTNGPQDGLYRGSVTFTALASTLDFGGPAFDHAAPGAHLELVVESVVGPPGGAFGFWEGAGEEEGSVLTFEVPAAAADSTNRFSLSENSGQPGEDPYGHVHGRVFSVTRPGLYTVGLRIVDTSTNGPEGGPLHPPSERFLMNFEGGVVIGGITAGEDGVRIEFAAESGYTFQLEYSAKVDSAADWMEVGERVAGDDHLQAIQVPRTSEGGFLRLRRDP